MHRPLKIEFQPTGRRAAVPSGTTLLGAAQSVGIDLRATCGGIGVCGTCRIQVVAGATSKATESEFAELGPKGIAAGYRLACQAHPLTDLRVEVPADSLTTSQRLQLESADSRVELDPMVVPVDLTLDPPTLADVRSDASRVRQALWGTTGGATSIRQPVLAELPTLLRDSGWQVRIALRTNEGRRQAVAALPHGTRLLGFAADIGTTKVAMYLLDLEGGETLGSTGALNPQIAYGEDVISRLAFAGQTADGAALLRRRITDCLREGIEELCRRCGADRRHIVDAVIVGNTAMQHLAAGLPTAQLGVAPYIAAVSDPLSIPARELGLPLASDATVHFPPNIAGFVGSDHVAMLLAVDGHEVKGPVLALDIGTNTEISLIHGARLVSCSCPSGPAFEGAHLTSGMRAGPGAIESVVIADDGVHVRTIDDVPAVGICGSGILDTTAQMLAAGMLDLRGNFRKDHPLLRHGLLVLAPPPPGGQGRPVGVHRRDILEIQLAKAAIQTGIATLLEYTGVPPEAVEEVIIAGAFGSYLDVRSAIQIGMFPQLPRDRFRQVGNAAGLGARQMLLSGERRRIAEALAVRAEYLEVSAQSSFASRYIKAIWF
jgi:uncharacterized 2Fe-2S/4Fe-4S cluster protein (DUF4445 family)